jgi:hypothetical protein
MSDQKQKMVTGLFLKRLQLTLSSYGYTSLVVDQANGASTKGWDVNDKGVSTKRKAIPTLKRAFSTVAGDMGTGKFNRFNTDTTYFLTDIM